MRQKIFFLKKFDSELRYVQGPIWKEFQRFSWTLSVSTNNSKCLDFFRIGLSPRRKTIKKFPIMVLTDQIIHIIYKKELQIFDIFLFE
ncbi:hypothetical protein GLYMA_06G218700v4 [Glycine max]|uniref:Uncharacterized protein n=1 Tax=Glycine max TaxID=3847 RepID=K7KWJ4_SOYBN|nr:hypothetical protein GLYMA_06G218700v4 [Glycine max]